MHPLAKSIVLSIGVLCTTTSFANQTINAFTTVLAPAKTTPPAAPVTPAIPTTKTTTKTGTDMPLSALPTITAAGGGSGKVWINTHSKAWHCSNSKFYGKTKRGEYLPVNIAKSKGYHQDPHEPCTL